MPPKQKKTSDWIKHVKATQKKYGVSYKKALQIASTTYKKRATKATVGRGIAFDGGLVAGAGLESVIKKEFKKLKNRAGKLFRRYGKVIRRAAGATGTVLDHAQNIARNLANSNPASRNGFPGERHAIELQGKYKGSTYNWVGPGTKVQKRLARGDPGINEADNAAKIHDIAYARIARMPRSQWNNAIIAADEAFLRAIRPFVNAKREVALAYAAIRGKLESQKAGLTPWSAFINKV